MKSLGFVCLVGVVCGAALMGCDRPVLVGTNNLNLVTNDDFFAEQNTMITLRASVSGSTTGFSFNWNQEAGATVEIADPLAAETEVGPMSTLGDYRFRVIVANSTGSFSQQFVSVTVVEEGNLPDPPDNGNDNGNPNNNTNTNNNGDGNADGNDNGNANGDIFDPTVLRVVVNGPNEIQLGAGSTLSASSPGEGEEFTYQWSLIDGGADIEEPTVQETRIEATELGNLEVQVTVTRAADGAEESASLAMTVIENNDFRIQVAGGSRTPVNQPVLLTANFAGAEGGDTISHFWEIVDGNGEFAMPLERTTEYTPTSTGIQVVRSTLTVTNRAGVEASDEHTIIVDEDLIVRMDTQVENLLISGRRTPLSVTSTNFDDGTIFWNWIGVVGDIAVTIELPGTTMPTVTAAGPGTTELEVSGNGEINQLFRSGTQSVFLTVVNDLLPEVIIDIEGFGEITIELDGEASPVTVANFLHYVDDDYYNGQIWHRVLPDFIIQAGGVEPDGDGQIVVDAALTRDPIDSEADNGLSNVRGTVAMALFASDTNSGTNGFFINLNDDNVFLDDQSFTVFGRVVSGLDIADEISVLPTGESTLLGEAPNENVIINSIRRVETEPPPDLEIDPIEL